MNCKSLLYVANTVAQTVAVNGSIVLGNIIRRLGCRINQSGSSIVLCGCDYYKVNVSVTLAPTVDGTATVSLFQDGNAVQGATGSVTTAAAAQSAVISFPAIVRTRGRNSSVLNLILTGVASDVTNVAITVEEE